jgi:hypothetical protein
MMVLRRCRRGARTASRAGAASHHGKENHADEATRPIREPTSPLPRWPTGLMKASGLDGNSAIDRESSGSDDRVTPTPCPNPESPRLRLTFRAATPIQAKRRRGPAQRPRRIDSGVPDRPTDGTRAHHLRSVHKLGQPTDGLLAGRRTVNPPTIRLVTTSSILLQVLRPTCGGRPWRRFSHRRNTVVPRPGHLRVAASMQSAPVAIGSLQPRRGQLLVSGGSADNDPFASRWYGETLCAQGDRGGSRGPEPIRREEDCKKHGSTPPRGDRRRCLCARGCHERSSVVCGTRWRDRYERGNDAQVATASAFDLGARRTAQPDTAISPGCYPARWTDSIRF